jgi:hypothetical protein
MTDLNEMIPSLLQGSLTDFVKGEELLTSSVQSLLEDEMKKHIRRVLDDHPEIKRELKKAMEDYLEARMRQIAAQVKIMGLTAKLGVLMIPEHVRKEFSEEMLSMFEKDLAAILEKAL